MLTQAERTRLGTRRTLMHKVVPGEVVQVTVIDDRTNPEGM